MDEMTFCVPTLFGLEGLAADELRYRGMTGVRAENGRVFFTGDELALARANLFLRTGERVLLLVGETPAATFDELFEGVLAMPWERYLTKTSAFPVTGYSLDSALHSVPDCQKIVKKAIVRRLGAKYRLEWLPETGEKVQLRFAIRNDRAELFLDTSGTALHKRGWRTQGNAAPLRETLAAAMVKLARYKGREPFRDPFCGSGTIPIEAALAARNVAPGLNRRFDAMAWPWLPGAVWDRARQEARDGEYHGSYDILGSDVDPDCVEIARANARRAGVADCVRFETADARRFSPGAEGGLLISNPPYGERVMEKKEAEALYTQFGRAVRDLGDWRLFLLSSHPDFETRFGRKATRTRKLYNGMIRCTLYQYLPETGRLPGKTK